MRIDTFQFGELTYFSKLLTDYTSGRLPKDLYPPYSLDMDGIESQLNVSYPLKISRDILSETIRQQYEGVEINDAVSVNIEKLKNNNTFTIVAAHQLSLLGGPLYYVIKIANAIHLAKKLKELHPDKHFVPVYWMGSEDHDFEEVNHIHLFGKKITWETVQSGPVGRFTLDNISPVVDQVKEILGENAPQDIITLIEKAYAQPTVELASRTLVNGLFCEYGLVIVNGDDKILKSSTSDIIKQEIVNQCSIEILNKRSEELKNAGYHAQATGREINLFYLQDGARIRIQPHSNGVEIDDKIWSESEILQEVDLHPERFSPNVVLRPLFQQSVLPNVAFIGGGGEIAYWLQLPEIFKHYEVRYPVLIPRTSLMFVNKHLYAKMQKLNLKVEDVFKDKEVLKKEYLLSVTEHNPSLQDEKDNIASILNSIKEKAAIIDPTLGPAAGADAQRILQTLDQMEGKMLRAIKHKNDTALKQIDQIYQSLFPQQSLQERFDNFLNYYNIYGKKIIETLVNELSVIDQEFVVMIEEENTDPIKI